MEGQENKSFSLGLKIDNLIHLKNSIIFKIGNTVLDDESYIKLNEELVEVCNELDEAQIEYQLLYSLPNLDAENQPKQ